MNDVNILKVKKINTEAVIPTKSHANDSGWDLVAIDDGHVAVDGYLEYKIGIAIEIPYGFDACIFPRSSISKYDLFLANGVGLIDEGYRGELLVRFKMAHDFYHLITPNKLSGCNEFCRGITNLRLYKKGDKIAQLVLRQRPNFEIQEVEELSSTVRSSGGFGSTGS